MDYFGRAPLHVACSVKGSINVVKYLCEQPIFLDLLDRNGRSALFIALSKGDSDVVQHLQYKGATAIANDEKWAKMLCIVGYEGNLP